MLINNQEKTFTNYRLTKTVGTDKEAYVSSGSLVGQIQPINTEDAALYGGDYSRSFAVFFDGDVDVIISDKLINSGKEYFVKGIKKYSNLSLSHTKVLVELK